MTHSASPLSIAIRHALRGIARTSTAMLGLGALCAAHAQSVNFTVLHYFDAQSEGMAPSTLVRVDDHTFIDTTGRFGGAETAFTLTTDGVYTPIHAFLNGQLIIASGALTRGADGNFYGLSGPFYGFLYSLSPSGTYAANYPVLPIGTSSAGLTLDNSGNLYGAIEGVYGSVPGSIFRLTPANTVEVVAQFQDNTTTPWAALTLGKDGNFYGSTINSGSEGSGTIYRVTSAGELTTLHSMVSATDGKSPEASLLAASDGALYGSTVFGGTYNKGTLFKITTDGIFTLLYSFTGLADGGFVAGDLIEGSDGNFYGSTGGGGDTSTNAQGCGTIFKITPGGVLTTLYTFNCTDGASPDSPMVQMPDGAFYGATSAGGNGDAGVAFKFDVGFPAAPTNLAARTLPLGLAAMQWDAVPNALSYNLYEGLAPGKEATTPAQTGLTKTWLKLKGLSKGQSYCFTIAAVTAAGPGPRSNEACITK